MDEQPRCVWLTREQRDVLSTIFNEGLIYAIVDAWDAAPADALVAVQSEITSGNLKRYPSRTIALQVLRALGCAKDPAC